MKRYALLVLPFLLASCVETNDPVLPTTHMNVTKHQILLSPAMPMDSALVALECGCRFTLSVEKFAGDTSVIHYSQRDASNGASRVAVDVTADTLAAIGSYSARLAILSTGAKGTFRDTIYVEYTRN
jgi:hypothetical protein